MTPISSGNNAWSWSAYFVAGKNRGRWPKPMICSPNWWEMWLSHAANLSSRMR